MKCKCPHCSDGCSKCDRGYTVASFASGQLWSLVCQSIDCGFENGGCIVGGSSPLKTIFDARAPKTCIKCGGETDWVYLGDN